MPRPSRPWPTHKYDDVAQRFSAVLVIRSVVPFLPLFIVTRIPFALIMKFSNIVTAAFVAGALGNEALTPDKVEADITQAEYV